LPPLLFFALAAEVAQIHARVRDPRKSGQRTTPANQGTLRGYFQSGLWITDTPSRPTRTRMTAFSPALQGHFQWSSPAGFHSPGSLNRRKTTYSPLSLL